MVEEIIIRDPSEKLLKLIEIMKAKKYSDQENLSKMKECTFTVEVD